MVLILGFPGKWGNTGAMSMQFSPLWDVKQTWNLWGQRNVCHLGTCRTGCMATRAGTFRLPASWKKKILTHLSLMEFQLDQSFSVLRAVVWYFSSNFNRTFCKQIVETLIRCSVLRHLIWETLIRCSVLRHLIWVCTICICPTRRTLCLYGLKPMAEMTWPLWISYIKSDTLRLPVSWKNRKIDMKA